MKRAAIFVEGKTEMLFLRRLLTEIAEEKNIIFEEQEYLAGRSVILSTPNVDGQKYYVLLYDCHGDGSVQSELLKQRGSLVRGGYEVIMGLRDLYPSNYSDRGKMEINIRKYVPTKPPFTRMYLAVMETEAWFVADHSHFEQVDAQLTIDNIRNALGIDLTTIDVESIYCPSQTLRDIYGIVGATYNKKGNLVDMPRTVNCLDMAMIYCDVPVRSPSLAEFLQPIDLFLAT